MKLGVGAVSRLVVEEAAKLQVPQIVASRRQVNLAGGYIGMTQAELVKTVKELSDGATDVVRDHGGPYQAGAEDDGFWNIEFQQDIDAGFDSLHIDVCKLPREAQPRALQTLVKRFAPSVKFEIGGERDEQEWLNVLVEATLDTGYVPEYAVMDTGGHIHADRQSGYFHNPEWVEAMTAEYNSQGMLTKAHNMDWYGMRHRYDGVLDAYNVAPEFSGAETDAWLVALSGTDASRLLYFAYQSKAWDRWFNDDEGTFHERARCAVRYVMNEPFVVDILNKYKSDEGFVRDSVRQSIERA